MKRPIGLAIAFTIALSLITHEPESAIQAVPATVPPVQQAETPHDIQPEPPVAEPALKPASENGAAPETEPAAPNPDEPQLEQSQPQKLDVPQRIASLVPGVERLFEATARK